MIRIPLTSAPKKKRRRSPQPVAPSQQKLALDEAVSRRVLIVDDNRDAAETLAEALQMTGHEVDVDRLR